MQLHVEVPVQLASELSSSEPFTAAVNDGQLTVFGTLPHMQARGSESGILHARDCPPIQENIIWPLVNLLAK